MKTKDNTVYILSSKYFAGEAIYLQSSYKTERITLKLGKAGVFKSEDQARHFLGPLRGGIWVIQPISSEIIFEARLKGI